MVKAVIINANRDGYTPGQCGSTMTIGELIDELEYYNRDLPVYLSHDNGYTYGALSEELIRERKFDNEDFEN